MRCVLVALLTAACACGSSPAGPVRAPDADADAGTPSTDTPATPPATIVGPDRPAPNVSTIFKTGCATTAMRSQLLPSNLLFVLDRSASMACNPPPATVSIECEQNPMRADEALVTKWGIVQVALGRAIDRLPAETHVGISYFSNDDACGVHSAPSVPLRVLDGGQKSAIAASLATVVPNGSTPLVGATVLAYQHMHQQALLGNVVGKKYVVLLTDGEQSEPCFDEARCDGAASCEELLLEQEVPRAAGEGVRINTFVIGAPGSEPARRVLSAIAVAGGTAPRGCDPEVGDCHFDMTTTPAFDEALEQALADIAGRSALSCELPMPSAGEDDAVDLALVNVVYSPGTGDEPEVIPQDARVPCDAGADGWQYTGDGRAIRLCGTSCQRVLGDPDGRVDVVLGCPVETPQ